MKTKILFVCLMGKDRSAKAAEIINNELSNEFEAKCAGVSEIADIPIASQAIAWADRIICMERENRDSLFQLFPEAREKPTYVWNIPNGFSFNDPQLEKELREKMKIDKNGKKLDRAIKSTNCKYCNAKEVELHKQDCRLETKRAKPHFYRTNFCSRCGEENPEQFLVSNKKWREVTMYYYLKTDILCKPCFDFINSAKTYWKSKGVDMFKKGLNKGFEKTSEEKKV